MASDNSKVNRRLQSILAEGQSRHVGARFGLEIEVEHKRGTRLGYDSLMAIAERLAEWWHVVEDGSLRDGRELVSLPLTPGSVPGALEAAYAWIEGAGYGPSVRCGLHIHSNMAGHTASRFSDVLGSYILAEPYLFAFVGQEREQNIYCVPWYLDYAQYDAAAGLCHDLVGAQNVRLREVPELGAACKYSALNLLPLFKFHTIEFRHAPCYETAEETLAWYRIVEAVSEKAPWICSRPYPSDAVAELMAEHLSSAQLEQARKTIEEHDILYRYKKFRKQSKVCTYKPENWGQPAILEAVEKGYAVPVTRTMLGTIRRQRGRRDHVELPPMPTIREAPRAAARPTRITAEQRAELLRIREQWRVPEEPAPAEPVAREPPTAGTDIARMYYNVVIDEFTPVDPAVFNADALVIPRR